nr:MAG TPA: hypothetical protein [Caudoviricetes sp.]
MPLQYPTSERHVLSMQCGILSLTTRMGNYRE